MPITTTLGAQRETFSSTDKGAQSIVSPIAGVVCISFDEKQWDSDRDHAIPTDVPSTLPATDETPNSNIISPFKKGGDEKSTSTAIPIIDWGCILLDEKQQDNDEDHTIFTDVPSILLAMNETPTAIAISPIKRGEDADYIETALCQMQSPAVITPQAKTAQNGYWQDNTETSSTIALVAHSTPAKSKGWMPHTKIISPYSCGKEMAHCAHILQIHNYLLIWIATHQKRYATILICKSNRMASKGQMGSRALQQFALLRRSFYPKQDVIKWNLMRLSCEVSFIIQEPLKRLLCGADSTCVETRYATLWWSRLALSGLNLARSMSLCEPVHSTLLRDIHLSVLEFHNQSVLAGVF